MFSRSLRIDVLACLDEILLVQSDHCPCGPVRIKARMPSRERFRAILDPVAELDMTQIWREHARSLGFARRSHLWLGGVAHPEHAHLVLGPMLRPLGYPLIDCRCAGHRLARRFRVVSPQLPAFLALSRDVSENGICLETAGPLAVGETLPLRLEPEASPGLTVQAEVRWCRPARPAPACLVGFQFDGLSVSQRVSLRAALADRPSRLSA